VLCDDDVCYFEAVVHCYEKSIDSRSGLKNVDATYNERPIKLHMTLCN